MVKKFLILLLSLTNISFAKAIIGPAIKKSSFADQIMKKADSSETDSIKSTDCKGGGDR